MPPEKRWSVKEWMIVIALVAVIFYSALLFYRGYVWMVKAGW
jgi:hypothetical protein